jgi:BirA family biotin operon repressor/biotin-[acetyl-CoA-carboxylase] ligase
MHTTDHPEARRHELWASLNAACEQLWLPSQALLAANMHQQGLTVEVLATIDSTNTELMRRARQGLTEPALLVALEQTAGRGRMGKHWSSQPGDSLTFSLGLPLNPTDWSGLSLAVGVSVAESLSGLLSAASFPPTAHLVSLKWPNDLWIDGDKTGGILVETASSGGSRYAVIGIGINIRPPQALPERTGKPDGLSDAPYTALPPAPPTGLALFAPSVDPATTLLNVIPPLLSDILSFETHGFARFAERFARKDALRAQPLILSDGTQGTGRGVDHTGALLVDTPQGVRSINSAEVSVRPASMLQTGGQPC